MSTNSCTDATSAMTSFEWLRVPESAAFRCGRLLNQIEHETNVLWLHGREEIANPSLGLSAYTCGQIPWRQLKLASRGVISNELRRMEFERTVDAAENDWTREFQTIWHIQLLRDQNEQIEVDRLSYLLEEEGPSIRDIIATRCRIILGAADELNRGLFNFLIASIDMRCLELLRLGQYVDRLVHPVPAFNELLQTDCHRVPDDLTMPETASGTDVQQAWGILQVVERIDVEPSDQNERSAGDRTPIIPNATSPWRLPRQPLLSCPPSDAWWEEFCCRATSCGLSFPRSHQHHLRLGAAWDHVLAAAHKVVSDITVGIDAQFSATPEDTDPSSGMSGESCTESPNTVNDAEEWEQTIVGLDINKNDRTIRIAGGKDSVPVESPTSFRILRFIARRGNRFTTKIEILDGWETFNDNEPPTSRSAVNGHITKLRRILRPLLFDFQSDGRGRDLGWRIIHRPSS